MIAEPQYQRSGRTGPRARPLASALTFALGILLLSLLSLVSAAAPGRAVAQSSRRFHMDAYNSDINVNPDGSLDIVETLIYVYDSGSFHRGTRFWDMGRFGEISNIRVTEEQGGQALEYRETVYDPDESTSGEPGTFGTTQEGEQLKVRWVYEYVGSGSSKVFRLSYHVTDAVRVYGDRDELDWYAVPPKWSGAINNSRVQVSLPGGVDASNLNVQSVPDAEVRKQDSSVVWTTSGDVSAEGFEVGVQIPKGVMSLAAPPVWQAQADAQEKSREEFRRIRPLIDFALLVIGLLALIGGVLWGIVRWYKQGRDKPVKLYADYITEPPSNLPPGLVGTLLDESADVRDVIATVVDQGRKGNLTIQEAERGGLFSAKDYEYAQTGSTVDFRFEEMVLNALFARGNPVRLSELKNHFYSSLPPIYDEMYRTLVALKYFPSSPKSVRAANIAGGVGFLLLAGLAGFGAASFADTFSPFLWMFPVALGATGLVRLLTAHIMPRKTDFGAEEAAKWRAFGNYLMQMKRYTDVQAAADKFQQYLPYAVALGVERKLTQQFESVPAAMPPYYIPYGYGPYIYTGHPYPVGASTGDQGVGMGGVGGGGGAPQFNPGEAMQGMSNSLASAMQGMSDSFAGMVNSASSALTSQPQSSGGGGGGWGGGGGSFGGGGGGGGGGGAD